MTCNDVFIVHSQCRRPLPLSVCHVTCVPRTVPRSEHVLNTHVNSAHPLGCSIVRVGGIPRKAFSEAPLPCGAAQAQGRRDPRCLENLPLGSHLLGSMLVFLQSAL